MLVTVDGGTSIGKPVLFDLDEEYAIDSHVAILRPVSLDPKVLVYLLGSPMGQLQFNQSESGASGQTGVTEEDIRRFRFPVVNEDQLRELVAALDNQRAEGSRLTDELTIKEKRAWECFNQSILTNAKPVSGKPSLSTTQHAR